MAMDDDKELGPIPAHIRAQLPRPDCWVRARDRFITEYAPLPPEPPPAKPGLPDEDDDDELADLRMNMGFFDLDRIEAVQCAAAPGGWLPLIRPGQFVHPRSETAHILRVVDRREGTNHSLKLISYGPVELAVRTWLAKLNWRRRRPPGTTRTPRARVRGRG